MKEIVKARLAEAQSTGPRLCIDLSMTDRMSDKVGDWLANLHKATVINGDPSYVVYLFQEISRLAGQLRRLYGSNKKATQPFHIFLTNMSNTSRLYKECLRMNDGFLNYMVFIFFKLAEFAGEYFWQEERIVDTCWCWVLNSAIMHNLRYLANDNKQNSIFQMEMTEESCHDLFSPETIVYLTPDAEEGSSRWRFPTSLHLGH